MKQFIFASLSILALSALALPAQALSNPHQQEFLDGLNRLTSDHNDAFFEGLDR